jgi:hypothetical protein
VKGRSGFVANEQLSAQRLLLTLTPHAYRRLGNVQPLGRRDEAPGRNHDEKNGASPVSIGGRDV